MFHQRLSHYVVPVLLIAVGAGGFAWLTAKDAPPERTATQPTAPAVETAVLQPGVSSFQIRVSGNVVPRREVTLSAEVAGAVVHKGKLIESGRHVRQGASLLQIDPARFELQVNELGNEIQQVAADLRRLEVEEHGTRALIQLVEREVEIVKAASSRLQALVLKNASSSAELEAVERAELQSQNTLRVLLNQRALIPIRRERLQAQLKLTQLEQERAQLNLDRTRIAAPFTGVISTMMVEQGDYVQTGDVLLQLEDTSAVDVVCSLQMDDLYWLWNSSVTNDGTKHHVPGPSAEWPPRASLQGQSDVDGAPANVASAEEDTGETEDLRQGDGVHMFEVPAATATVTAEVAGRLFHWKGQLSRYEGGGINRKTRTVSCRVTVAEPVRADAVDGPPTLMRGMYVTVMLNVAPQLPLLRIPTHAVQPNGQVWTVDHDLLQVHTVEPAKVLPDAVLVRADSTDLKPGDRVVITPLATPLAGSRVREFVRDSKPDETMVRERGSSP